MKPLINDIKDDAQENINSKTSASIDFDVLETIIPELFYVHPEREKTKQNFIKSSKTKKERTELFRILDLWEDLLENENDVSNMISHVSNKIDETNHNYKTNLNIALNASRDLEEAYRSVALFYDNTNEKKVTNISVLNASINQIKDLDNSVFIDAVRDEIIEAYDRLDLRENYSLLVVPGYLGSQIVLEKWSKIAHANKLLLVTDFMHLDEPDDVVEFFEQTSHVDTDTYLSNTIMTCNWLVGRGKYDAYHETEDLYLPPSTALAGKIYSNKISQASAGTKFGILNSAQGVRFELKKNDLANLERLGIIPVFYENGKVIAYSAKTLFNGDNLGLQTYSVVRVFDYLSKAFMDYFNRKTFENFNVKVRREFMQEIVEFLDKNTGPDNLIESFSIKKLEQDLKQKDRVSLELHIEPYFPAKNFLIRMDGKIGGAREANAWESFYDF